MCVGHRSQYDGPNCYSNNEYVSLPTVSASVSDPETCSSANLQPYTFEFHREQTVAIEQLASQSFSALGLHSFQWDPRQPECPHTGRAEDNFLDVVLLLLLRSLHAPLDNGGLFSNHRLHSAIP